MAYGEPTGAAKVEGIGSNTTPKFDFNGHQLRSVLIDGEPWFVAADACRILYGRTGGVGWVYDKLDADERSLCDRTTLGMNPGRPMTIISRPGLFKLIQRSNKPEAKEFDRWVRHEVLPQVKISPNLFSGLDPRWRHLPRLLGG